MCIRDRLEIVPAGKARECGLDRSMIAAYGQDDRVCAYTSLLAMLGMDTPKPVSYTHLDVYKRQILISVITVMI